MNSIRCFHFWLVAAACLFAITRLVVAQDSFSDSDIEFFESKIRPILVERCFECHGEDLDLLEGGLSLSCRQFALEGGDSGPAIDLETPLESLLIEAINYGDLFEMPPDSKLPQSEIDLLTEWVKRKAPWPVTDASHASKTKQFDLAERAAEHWCWQPIQTVEAPQTQGSWGSDPIDKFILSKLEQQNMQPAAPADKRALIRRAYIDLVGLLPTPEQVDKFVNDPSEDAFESVLDQLLDSDQFGERWARHWMDLIRYAETCGHEFDYPIHNAYQFSDYLIRACLLYTSPSPRDRQKSRMPSSA